MHVPCLLSHKRSRGHTSCYYVRMSFLYRQTLPKTDGLTVVFVSDTNRTLSKTGSDCKWSMVSTLLRGGSDADRKRQENSYMQILYYHVIVTLNTVYN